MVFLKHQSHTFFIVLFFIAGISACKSSPPVDLTDPMDPGAPSKRLNEDDLVYTDNTAPLPDVEKDFTTIRTSVDGRSVPGRQGKILIKLHPGDRVRILKTSQDHRWTAIATIKGRHRAWVPVNALNGPKADPNAARVKPPAPTLGPGAPAAAPSKPPAPPPPAY